METSLVNLEEVFSIVMVIDEEQREISSYTDALYNAFVIVQKGQMSNRRLSSRLVLMITKILHYFLWEYRQNQKTESESVSCSRKLERLAKSSRTELVAADSIYAVFSEKKTGEASFSQRPMIKVKRAISVQTR